ncbi:MAG: hypothetical protein IRY99_09980 [Isosphaeraceae bacterium]|nr:hypothetical protein [Isosphaeraceae bacterium]
MAGKPQNRLELRRQYEAAEPLDPMEDESEDLLEEPEAGDESERRPKKKKATTKAKTKAVKPAKPAARMRIVWCVVNDAFKTVATFDYNQKEAALARAAELTAKGRGTHFVQKVKEPMPDNAPGIGATIPRPTTPTAPPEESRAPVEDEVDSDDEDEIEGDLEETEDEEEE